MQHRLPLALALGLILGAAVVTPLALAAKSARPVWTTPIATVRTGAPAGTALATRLMGQVARMFVHQAPNPDGGISFFEQPTPFGENLCRIREHDFAGRVAARRPWRDDNSPTERLEVRDVFAVWREPGEPEGGGREAACSAWRDFHGLISGDDGIAIERAAYVIAQAGRAARAGGPVPFKVTCIDRRDSSDRPQACDGLEILRSARTRHIRQVMPLEDTWPDDTDDYDPRVRSAVWRDQVWMDAPAVGRSCGQSESLSFKLTTLQVFGRHSSSEGELQAIKIERDVIC